MPIKFKFLITIPKLDTKKYIKAIDKYVEAQQLIAIKRWLLSVLKNTPTYTGTARGTYAPIGRVVKHTVRRGRKGGSSDHRTKKKFTYKGKAWPTGLKAGENYSEFFITKKITNTSTRHRFEFHQNLPYAVWNQMMTGPAWFKFDRDPPWNAHKSGETAFRRYVNGPLKKNFPRKIIANRTVLKG